MKKVFYLLFLVSLGIILTGCNKDNLNLGEKSNYDITEDQVIINIDKESITNTGIKITLVNKTENEYEYGSGFTIEYFKNNNWYLVTPKKETDYNMMSYSLEPNAEKVFEYNWKEIYGELPKGKYRVIKELDLRKENNSFDKIIVAAEFIIE